MHFLFPVSLLLIVTLTACVSPEPQTRGADIYSKHCTSCHGQTALGDGPRSADLGVQPANLTLLSKRNGGTFPIEEVMAQIHGYSGRHQFGAMPEFGQDLAGPMVDWVAKSGEVIPTPKGLIDLAAYLEGIQK
ncbi:MAG: cytochrome c [Sulfitobacter sp.]|nr:cytochrome c [Sulfitobacter sp.]MDG1352239.1 cytochrome c [Sulfitobacter sp.]